jgi:hypothetical protein
VHVGLLETAVRVYVGYAVSVVIAVGLAALVGQVLPGGWALFVAGALVVVLALDGAGRYGRTR